MAKEDYSPRGGRQHFIPAAFIGRFSANDTGRARKRKVWVRDLRATKISHRAAANLAREIGLYDVEDDRLGQGRTLDIAWSYEVSLPGALDQLANHNIALRGEVWISTLVPFVAGLFIRGPDFQREFQTRFHFLEGIIESGGDNATGARLIEFQQLLAPIMAARWTVLHFADDVDLVTSDTGFAGALTPLGQSYVVPLDRHTALTVTPSLSREIVRWTNVGWMAEIEHAWLLGGDADLRRAMGAFARHAVYGPTPESVEDAVPELGAAPPIGPWLFGAQQGVDLECHLYDYFRVMSAISCSPDEAKAATSNINWGSIGPKWAAPVAVEVLLGHRTAGAVNVVSNAINIDLTYGLRARQDRLARNDFSTGAMVLYELPLLIQNAPRTGQIDDPSHDRDQLVEDLTRFLDRVYPPHRDPQAVLDPSRLQQARRLADLAEPWDIVARRLIGLLHWFRYRILPEGQDRVDLHTALSVFADILPIDADLVPSPIPQILGGGDPDTLADAALGLLEDPLTQADLLALDRAIHWLRLVVASTSADDPNLPGRMSNLGVALETRFARTGDLADLNEAVQVDRDAVAATPSYHQDGAGRRSNLALALRARFERTDDLADLDEALNVGREALAATPTDDRHWAERLSNLGVALHARFERTGNLADLTEAIQADRDAITATPTDHRDWPGRLSNLALALHERYLQNGDDVSDLNESIQMSRIAMAAAPTDDPDQAGLHTNLGIALRTRGDRTGEVTDLTAAVQAARDTLAATPPDHANRAEFLSNLGLALQTRYAHVGDLADLNEAVQVIRDAVTATPTDHPKRAGYLSSLSLALHTRHKRTGDPADLYQAVQVGREAAAGHSQRLPELS